MIGIYCFVKKNYILIQAMAQIGNLGLPPLVEKYLINRKSMEVIFLWRQQKVNIPWQVKKIFACKEKVPYSEVNGTLPDTLEGFTCVHENCVLVDSSCIILGILVHNFFNGKIAQGLLNKVNSIYSTRACAVHINASHGRPDFITLACDCRGHSTKVTCVLELSRSLQILLSEIGN